MDIQQKIVNILDNFTKLSTKLSTELTNRKKQYEYYRDHLLTFDNKVEWKPLKNVTRINYYKQISANEINSLICDGGNVHLLPSSNNYNLYADENKCKNLVCNGEVITLGKARYANIKYCNGKFISSNNVIIESTNKYELLTRFIYHFICCKLKLIYVETSTYPKFDINVFNNLKIPIPSLHIQEKIVKVLDNFEKICSDLQIGLPAEIDARKKQYEYYRDKLLSFDLNVTIDSSGSIERERERE